MVKDVLAVSMVLGSALAVKMVISIAIAKNVSDVGINVLSAH